MAQALEEMRRGRCYVKNQGLGFTIPYTFDGRSSAVLPDFIARCDDGHGDDLLNLVIEVTGERRKDKAEKVATTRDLWVPGGERARRLRPLGLRRGHRPVGRARTRDPQLADAGLAAASAAALTDLQLMPPAKKATKTRQGGRTDAGRGHPHTRQARQHPDRRAPRLRRRRGATPLPVTILLYAETATRPSTPSSSGRARTSRTPRTSPCPRCRSTSRRRSTRVAIVENLRDTAAPARTNPSSRLFDDFDGLDGFDLVEFYEHESNWSNRMILGDSLLVMTSLAEKEELGARSR